MPIQAKRAPFFDHVVELRKRLTICIVAVIATTLICYQHVIYVFTFNLLLKPLHPYLPNNGHVFAMGPFESMTLRFQIAFIAALVVMSPLLLYHIFAFFLPALKKRERKWLIPTVAAAILLFLGGVLFAYFVIMGPAFKWLIAQAVGPVQVLPAASDYLSGITLLLLGFGISFELPLVVFYLIGFGILKYHAIRSNWRYVYVILFVVAAIATPDWSPWPMLGLTAALIILYETSLFMTRRVFYRRIWGQEVDAWEDFQLEYDPDNDDVVYQAKYKRLKKLGERAAKKLADLPEKPDDDDDDEEEDI
ncbi:MAG: twin-arginine translocase subunit TatC [Coriobacteriia bacterium]|nr:twin-arginine translocase subunit TatC [Coriobacteriia bacterium]